MSFLKTARKLAALFLSSILFITFLICFPAIADESKTAPASIAPDFVLKDLKGSDVSLSQFKGEKPVLLYFWATWCHYCLNARPSVINLQKTSPDIQVIAIDVGSGDSIAKLKRFEEADPAPYIVLYDTDSKVSRSFHVEGIPHFVLIDKSGAVKYKGNQLPSDPMKLLSEEGQ
jgi:peroxiredoxin